MNSMWMKPHHIWFRKVCILIQAMFLSFFLLVFIVLFASSFDILRQLCLLFRLNWSAMLSYAASYIFFYLIEKYVIIYRIYL